MLPINAIRTPVIEAWHQGGAIIGAPPGSGKTTQLPLWLLDADPAPIYLLIPKRLAVTLAARQLADNLNEQVGERVGYQLRHDSRLSQHTRLIATTYGTFLRLLINDPDRIAGSTLIFDEFHERSAEQDLTYALVNQYVDVLDDSVRRLFMSATLNVEHIARQTGLPVIESEGRSFPVTVSYRKADVNRPDTVAAIIREQHQRSDHHLLVFCPGIREIRAIERRLNLPVLILHGTLEAAPDLAALDNAPPTIILATNIAESSITLPSVHTVIDLGTERYAHTHPVTGMTELKTRKISQSSAIQRAGRAGRLGPGQAIRLWSEEDHQSLIPHQTPPIRETELTSLALLVAGWGSTVEDLPWLEAPPLHRWQIAQQKLMSWHALSDNGTLTDHGRTMFSLGLDPWLAHLLSLAQQECRVSAGCLLAAHIVTGQRIEYDLFSPQSLSTFTPAIRKEVNRLAQRMNTHPETRISPLSARLLTQALTDRIMYFKSGSKGQMITGTAVQSREPPATDWAVLIDGIRKDGAVQSFEQIPVNAEAVFRAVPPTEDIQYHPGSKPAFRRVRRIGGIELESQPCQPDPEHARDAWLRYIRQQGEHALPWSDDTRAFKQRWLVAADCMNHWPAWPAATAWPELVSPFLAGLKRLESLDLMSVLKHALSYEQLNEMDRQLPRTWLAPSGRKIELTYLPEKATAMAALKLQEIFGLEQSPLIAGNRPVQLDLQAPNGRSVASVTDLPHFWSNVYPEVRKELRGRYSKHPWPEDPLSFKATAKTNRQLRTPDTE